MVGHRHRHRHRHPPGGRTSPPGGEIPAAPGNSGRSCGSGGVGVSGGWGSRAGGGSRRAAAGVPPWWPVAEAFPGGCLTARLFSPLSVPRIPREGLNCAEQPGPTATGSPPRELGTGTGRLGWRGPPLLGPPRDVRSSHCVLLQLGNAAGRDDAVLRDLD